MKQKNTLYIIMCLSAMLFTACDKDAHKDEKGVTVNLSLPGEDAVSDTRLWVYRPDGLLLKGYHDTNPKVLYLEPLAPGDYVLIAATNLVAPFSTGQVIADGVKSHEGLMFQLDEPSASPAHAHYGVQTLQVSADGIAHAEVKMSRILAEIQFTIKSVPAEVTEVEANVTNVAKGFLPYSRQLLPATHVASLGKGSPLNGVISFPLKRLMPVVKPVVERQTRTGDAPTTVTTLLQFSFRYADGNTITFDAEAPALENGGTYTPEIKYEQFRPGVTLQINAINGWVELPDIHGDLLNPSK